jgi:hypothetical protein
MQDSVSFPKLPSNPALDGTRLALREILPTFRVFAGLLAPDVPTMVCHSLRSGLCFKGPAQARRYEEDPWQPHRQRYLIPEE